MDDDEDMAIKEIQNLWIFEAEGSIMDRPSSIPTASMVVVVVSNR